MTDISQENINNRFLKDGQSGSALDFRHPASLCSYSLWASDPRARPRLRAGGMSVLTLGDCAGVVQDFAT